ncbi:ABC-three component system protein [Bradyrhizobium sp. 62B]|uniref:ABC-three component system protein n=1 Tax=Bradyrhizobium sp. 62B TaxID=2898442 RepID=UPI0025582191|nr:ABC-three component system protein [Bradyrhizobium sp. 62B]
MSGAQLSGTFHFAAVAKRECCADVIFVHGLTGDAVETWTCSASSEAEGNYWPNWLSADLPSLSFYTIGYPAGVFAQWAKKEMNLHERAKSTLETLAGYSFGDKPIVFVCHSLGGLLVKQMLRTAAESNDDGWNRIADSCAGIYFLATPHTGSSLADLLKTFVRRLTSVHVDKLAMESPELDDLNESFRMYCHGRKIDVCAYYEKYKTHNVALVVDKRSADPGVGGAPAIAVDADHLTICKPTSRHDVVYLGIHRRLKKLAFEHEDRAIGDAFASDDLQERGEDRRTLLEKMASANREHEYMFANESQNRFAREFFQQGLITRKSQLHNNLLADVEQYFQSLIYHPLICTGANNAVISAAILREVIEPLSFKYSAHRASTKTIMNALYFLTERCHVRWDAP